MNDATCLFCELLLPVDEFPRIVQDICGWPKALLLKLPYGDSQWGNPNTYYGAGRYKERITDMLSYLGLSYNEELREYQGRKYLVVSGLQGDVWRDEDSQALALLASCLHPVSRIVLEIDGEVFEFSFKGRRCTKRWGKLIFPKEGQEVFDPIKCEWVSSKQAGVPPKGKVPVKVGERKRGPRVEVPNPKRVW